MCPSVEEQCYLMSSDGHGLVWPGPIWLWPPRSSGQAIADGFGLAGLGPGPGHGFPGAPLCTTAQQATVTSDCQRQRDPRSSTSQDR